MRRSRRTVLRLRSRRRIRRRRPFKIGGTRL